MVEGESGEDYCDSLLAVGRCNLSVLGLMCILVGQSWNFCASWWRGNARGGYCRGGNDDFWKWWSHAITNHDKRGREGERKREQEREEKEEAGPPRHCLPQLRDGGCGLRERGGRKADLFASGTATMTLDV